MFVTFSNAYSVERELVPYGLIYLLMFIRVCCNGYIVQHFEQVGDRLVLMSAALFLDEIEISQCIPLLQLFLESSPYLVYDYL